MKAMILAAGRGERMRPLTDTTPKPLLIAGGKALIVHTIEQLVQAGFNDIVINHAHLGQQIETELGDGREWGAHISYSAEYSAALETAGGIIKALPLLGKETFLVVNGDIATDFPFTSLAQIPVKLAHLVMVNNPTHHPEGDFGLDTSQHIIANAPEKLTFSGIGLYHAEFFYGTQPGKQKLLPLLLNAIAKGQVSGQKYDGFWMDIGTPERLQQLDTYYQHQTPRL
ncbi:MAG: nucleotidyltransferase family protein [Methylococcaceae bacterium]|jgi:MurNAc alpha-1-phosphate uridylyltransferase